MNRGNLVNYAIAGGALAALLLLGGTSEDWKAALAALVIAGTAIKGWLDSVTPYMETAWFWLILLNISVAHIGGKIVRLLTAIEAHLSNRDR